MLLVGFILLICQRFIFCAIWVPVEEFPSELLELEADNLKHSYTIQLEQQMVNLMDLNFEYGIWSQYTPVSQVKSLGSITQSDCTVLNYVVDASNTQTFFYYFCYDNVNDKIVHNIHFIIENTKYQQSLAFNTQSYEGIWMYFHLASLPTSNQFSITTMSADGIQYSYQEYNHLFPYNQGYNTIYIGDSVIITNTEFSEIPNLQSFRGNIIIYRLNQQVPSYQIYYDFYDIQYLASNYNEQLYPSCDSDSITYSYISDEILSEQGYNYDNKIQNKYQLSGWFKMQYILDIVQDYTFINIAPLYSQIDNLSFFTAIGTRLTYYVTQQGKSLLRFHTYSYKQPILKLENIEIIEETFEFENPFTNWHFINILFNKKSITLVFNLYPQNINKKYIVNQFQYYELKLNLAPQIYHNILQTELVLLENCPYYYQTQTCYFTCVTCSGPTKLQCQSCDPQQHRILKYNQCVCEVGYVEYSYTEECISNIELSLDLIESYDIQENPNLCDLGYLKYQDECLKCPGVINHNIIYCIECSKIQNIQNMQNYIFLEEPKCQTYFYHYDNDDNNIMIDKYLLYDYQYFLIYQNEFLYCEYCFDFNGDEPYKYTHAEQIVNVQCDFEHLIINGLCQKVVQIKDVYYNQNSCGSQCQYCSSDLCYDCIDKIKYYKSLHKRSDCIPCLIKNCKYCMDYSINDGSINSISLEDSSENYDDIISGCALCYDGFTYNMNTHECEQLYPITPCLRQIINTQNQLQCLITSQKYPNGNAIQYSQCSEFIPNCSECINDNGYMSCVLCNANYKVIYSNMQCQPCNNQNGYPCSDTSFYNLETWKIEFQSFTYYLTTSLYKLDISPYFHGEIQLACPSTQEFIIGVGCADKCDTSDTCSACVYTSQDDHQICTSCNPSYKGYKILSSNKNLQDSGQQCQNCPNLCNFCYGQSYSKCALMEPIDQFTYIDRTYGKVRFCQEQKKCIKQFMKTWLIDCSNKNILLIDGGTYEKFDQDQDIYEQLGNHLAVNKITYKFIITEDLLCNEEFQIGFSAQIILQSLIDYDSLEELEYIFISNNYKKIGYTMTEYLLDSIITRIHFEKLHIILQSMFYVYKETLNMNTATNYEFNDIIFQGDCQSCVLSFNMNKMISLTMENIIIKDVNLYNQQVIKYINIYDTYQSITLKNITFINCMFFSVTFLEYLSDITIDSIIFENCTFSLFRFIKPSSTDISVSINVNNIYLHNSIINGTYLFQFSSYSNVQLNNITYQNCIIEDSTLFSIQNSITINQLYFIENTIVNTQIIPLNLIYYQPQLEFIFNNFIFKHNYFLGVEIIKLNFKEDQNILIKLDNFYHENQTHGNEQASSILYKFNSFYQSSATNTINYLSMTQTSFQIQINQFSFIQKEQVQLSFWKECSSSNSLPHLISIIGFTIINIINCDFYRLNLIDKQILELNSESVSFFELLNLQNITFQEIQLVKKSEEGALMGFISISLKQDLQITINQIYFIDNLINFYTQDLFLTPACFLTINCYSATLNFTSIYLYRNYLSNSTATFFSIQAGNVLFNNLTSIANNQKDITNLVIQPSPDINQQVFSDMIKQHFEIQSNPGLGTITSQSLKITNSQFRNSKAYSTNIFKMVGKQNCTFIMYNVTITNQTSNLDINPQVYGCFFIDSPSSILNIEIQNITLNNIRNRMESAFLYIGASQYANNVTMNNLTINNLFSLSNALMFLDQSKTYSNTNNLLIQNVIIQNDESKFKEYLQQLRQITNQYNNNGYLYVNKGIITLYNISIEGYFNSRILQIVDVEQLILRKLNFKNIKTLQPLIEVQVTNSIQIYESLIRNIEQIYISNDTSFPNDLSLTNYDIQGQSQCQLVIRQNLSEIQESNIQKQDLFYYDQLLMAIQSKFNGWLQIEFTDQVNINIAYTEFINLNANSALFYIQDNTLKSNKIQFSKCTFINNNLTNGTINIQSNNQNLLLIIFNSLFKENICTSGCSVYAINIKLVIQQSQFLNNQASLFGGGIYIKSVQQIEFYDSKFLHNLATRGGALFIQGFQLSNENLNNLTFDNNSYIEVVENPSSLLLKVNDQIFPSDEYQNQQINISHPKLIKYLMLPSQQLLKNYKRFNQITNLYDDVSFKLEFQGLNFQHEILMDLTETVCFVSQNIINLTTYEVIIKRKSNIEINFDQTTNSYNFENNTFIFDPYSQQDKALQLLIQCNSISDEHYQYQLNVRTYPCQMGEYYYDEGCFMCDEEKGFYSVKQNSTVCHQIDINKIRSNTANMLDIQPGYWRSNYHTNDIRYCGTMEKFCLGGWKVDYELCYTGHIGALCEECDIYNKHGNGQYFKDSQHNCPLCKESWGPIISLTLLSIWTFLSIALTVRSMKFANLQYRSLILGHKHFAIIAKYNQDLAGCLIKMLSNQLLVLAAVYQFQQGISLNLFWIEDIASPSLSASFNFDCWFSRQHNIDILYFRVFLILIIPFAYLNISIWAYLIYIIYKKVKYESSTIYIIIVYLFVVTQPDIIKYNGALITSRNISGINWIQANVSYFYDTITHTHWMLYVVLPILRIWCAIIPLYFGMNLYWNKSKLRYTSFRAKWSYLYNEYQQSRYFWEIVKVLQRELQILMLTLFFSNIPIKVYLLFFIQFFYLLTITKMMPFNSEQLNRLEIESVQKCILILIFGLTSWSTSNDELQVIHLLSYSLLLLTTILHIGPFIFNIINIYFKKYESSLDKLIQIIQNKPFLKSFFNRYLQQIIRNKERKEVVKQRYEKIRQYLKLKAKSIKQFEKQQTISLKTEKNHTIVTDQFKTEKNQTIGIDQILSPQHAYIKSDTSFINSNRRMLSERE